jgi:hypothetical protein
VSKIYCGCPARIVAGSPDGPAPQRPVPARIVAIFWWSCRESNPVQKTF